MFNQIMFYITMIISILALASTIYFTVSFVKNKHTINIDYKKNFIYIGSSIGVMMLFFMLFLVFTSLYNGLAMKPIEWVGAITSGLLFPLGLGGFFASFAIHYYKKGLDARVDKGLYISMFCSIIVMVLFFVFGVESFAAYIYYPLSLGIRFDSSGVWFPNYVTNKYVSSGGLTIAWYALFILSGAVLVYFVCDHKLYQQYGKHGLLESTFFVALPAGIIGARIWFVVIDVIGNPSSIFRTDWTAIFRIWDGGLAIMGGAILGILVGSLWFKWRRKGYKLLHIADIAVPSILIAQAVGRWGNFFNYEVYGQAVAMSSWQFIPSFIRAQMDVGFSQGGVATGTTMYVPLFYIEFWTNLTGYFLITYAIGKPLKRYLKLGDLACCYLIWYGITRAVMEPMRYSSFEYDISWYSSFVLIGGGILLIIFNHIFRYCWGKKHPANA